MAQDNNEKDELVAILGIEVNKTKLDQSTKKLRDFTNNLKSLKTGTALLAPELTALGMALAAIAAVPLAELFAGNQAKNVLSLRNQAEVLGMTTKQLQALQLAAKSSQVDVSAVTGVISSLRTQLLGFSTGTPPTQLIENLGKASSLLGVSISPIGQDGKIKTAYTLFSQVAEAIGRIHDKTKQAAVSTLVFGKNLAPLLDKGMGGIDKAFKELNSRSLFISDSQIKNMQVFNEQMAVLSTEFDQIKIKVASSLVPALSVFNEKLLNITKSKGFINTIDDMSNAFGTLITVLIKALVLVDRFSRFAGNKGGDLLTWGEKKMGILYAKNSMAAELTPYAKERLSQINNTTSTSNSSRSTTNVNINTSPKVFVPSYSYFGSSR